MKTKITISLIVITGLFIVFNFLLPVNTSTSGSPGGKTGSPQDGATCLNCHSGSPLTQRNGWITSAIPVSGYVPGTTYTITVTGTSPGSGRFGFEITSENSSGKYGQFTANGSENQALTFGQSITHTSSGAMTTGNTKTWSFDWKAPFAKTGDITFYGAFVVAYGNFGSIGNDSVFTSTLTVKEDVTNSIINNQHNPFQFDCFPNPVIEDLNVAFTLNQPSSVDICIYDLKGSKIRTLYIHSNISGNINKKFNVADLNSGVYFVYVNINNQFFSKKLIINQ